MRHLSLPIGIFAIACALLAGATTAHAVVPETWVSGTGSDTGTCTRAAPCLTFQFAHSQTSANGAINVLSSGNFGRLTITKPISVVAEGVEAVINTAFGGAAIKVQAPANAVVSLRGLTIDLRGSANDGISFVSGAALHVQNCAIRRTRTGINFVPDFGISELSVADSVITNTSSSGLVVLPSGSAGAKVVLDRVRAENSSNYGIAFSGVSTTGTITATVRDSVLTGNPGSGIGAVGGSGTVNVMIDRSALVNNNFGISANNAGATIRIGDSTVSGNTTGLVAGGGTIESYGTNKMDGNGTAVSGTIGMATYQ